MPIDIIIFAVIAVFLIWKLKNVINSGEETFLKKDFKSNSPQIIPDEKIKVSTVGKVSEKKAKQVELLAISTLEKTSIPPEYHSEYDAIFMQNPNMTTSAMKSDISIIYEDLVKAVINPTFLITNFAIEHSLSQRLKAQSEIIKHQIFLEKISSIEIQSIFLVNKIIRLTALIESKQIIFSEDENGNIVTGSKTISVPVSECLTLSRMVNGTGLWLLEDIKN